MPGVFFQEFILQDATFRNIFLNFDLKMKNWEFYENLMLFFMFSGVDLHNTISFSTQAIRKNLLLFFLCF